MVPKRIPSRDVFDANGRTLHEFRGRIVGHFQRSGPNAWDDYVFEPTESGEEIEILPGIAVQVENHGAVFRVRHRGGVVVVEWMPTGGFEADETEIRKHFLATMIKPEQAAGGFGVAAGIAGTLAGTPPKPLES